MTITDNNNNSLFLTPMKYIYHLSDTVKIITIALAPNIIYKIKYYILYLYLDCQIIKRYIYKELHKKNKFGTML